MSLTVAVIVGSTRQGRFAETVSTWFTTRAKAHDGLRLDVIDLHDAGIPDRLTDDPPAAVQAVSPRLAAADAFVVITPEYNHSYPASLKALIDWHFTEWQAKPVAFVSYGGISGGLRAVEHLRAVFAELHAVTIRDGVAFPHCWSRFDDTGSPADPHADQAVEKTLDQLTWWAQALRDARASRPYAA
ncbi:NAD(P)H-dependent oxidoreductase [Actinocorallia libanotica]|uniref:NAD(P)H-dependent oxidoreductase n=1 Tax=Actinocorallia libanotica TaxID=46162 RepID=A0ABN1RQ77_9ACTN